MDTEGSWFATIKAISVYSTKNEENTNNSSTTFQLSDFTALPRDKKAEFR